MLIPHPHVPLTYFQKEALTGSMLGDGHLSVGKNNVNATLSITRAIKDDEYLKYEWAIFNNYLPKRYLLDIKYRTYYDQKYDKFRSKAHFATIASSAFTPFHKKWYNENKVKIVPNDLKLSAISIAHWICDDGSVLFNKLPYRFVLELATHGFTEVENHFLADLLRDRYGEEFIVRKQFNNKTQKTYFSLRARDSACRAVFADIDHVFKMERKRKWIKPESRFFENQPPRQIRKVEGFFQKKAIIAQIISEKQELTLAQLAKKLGYNNKNDRIDYISINKLLKHYLDNGLVFKDVDNYNNNTTTLRYK